jgi:hypothetical protein
VRRARTGRAGTGLATKDAGPVPTPDGTASPQHTLRGKGTTMTRTITLALAPAALGLAAGCSSGTTTVHPAAASSTAARTPASTSCPGISCTRPSSSVTAPATGPLGTTFTVTYYGANANYTATYKIRLMKETDPAKTIPRWCPDGA